MSTKPPRITVGLPVYNGEEFLRQAIGTIQAQTMRDFELVIRDNASTDATQRICEEAAASDDRIRYVRGETNIGAAGNFNELVDLARGVYFKWAAHDDLCAPDLLEKCTAKLDREPDAVLCYPRARVIDASGNAIEDYRYDLGGDGPSRVQRFRHLIRGHRCYEVFGLIRTDALRQTGRILPYAHGDGVLLVQLGLLGRLVEVPEPLFFPRRHSSQSMRMLGDYTSYAAWFDPKLKGKWVFPYWRILLEHAKSLSRFRLKFGERIRCYGWLLRWAYWFRNGLKLDLKLAAKRLLGGNPFKRRRKAVEPAADHQG